MTLVDRLTLVLEQFDMTFQVAADGRRTLCPCRFPLTWRSSAIIPASHSRRRSLRRGGGTPDCQFRVVGSRIYVKGLIEDHERIEAAPGQAAGQAAGRPPRRPAQPRAPEQVFTAKNANVPLGVLSAFAKQLGLELQIDAEKMRQAGISLDQLISFEVEQAVSMNCSTRCSSRWAAPTSGGATCSWSSRQLNELA